MNFVKTAILGAALCVATQAASAHEWDVDPSASALAFGSVKKDFIGETHSMAIASGTVEHDGGAVITLDLASVNTGIDVRNGRIIEHVFGGTAEATVTADIDMGPVEALAVGGTMPLELNATLHFLGKDIGFSAPVIAVRLSDGRAMVVSDGMVWFDTEELGIDAGVDMLQELASLPSITRAVPVTFRLVFDMKM